jgi:hypothetical protein
MIVSPLGAIDQRVLGATHSIIVDFTDLTGTAATSKTQELMTSIPANTRFRYVGHILQEDFDGPSITELTMAIGYDLSSGTDDNDGFQAATSVCGAATEVEATPELVTDVATDTIDTTFGTEESTVLTSLRTKVNTLLKLLPRSFTVAWDLDAVFTATGANLSVLTAGRVQILVERYDLNQAEKAIRS